MEILTVPDEVPGRHLVPGKCGWGSRAGMGESLFPLCDRGQTWNCPQASHYSSYIESHQSYCSSFAIKVFMEERDKWGPGKTTRAKGRLDASRKHGGQSRGQDRWILGSALPSQLQHNGQDHLAAPASSSWIPQSSDEPVTLGSSTGTQAHLVCTCDAMTQPSSWLEAGIPAHLTLLSGFLDAKWREGFRN